MSVKAIIYKVTFLSFLLSGCANSLYFYETEKFSLTVEARPDSTQPVQGNLGIKQRVGLIVPGQSVDKNSKENNNGEALSSISNFNLKISPEGLIIHPILIQTAFVTGDAASQLDEVQASRVAQAITVENLSAMQLSAVDLSVEKLFSSNNKLDIKKFEDFLSCAGFKQEEVQNYVNKYQDKSLIDFKTAFREDFSWEAPSYFVKCRKSLGE